MRQIHNVWGFKYHFLEKGDRERRAEGETSASRASATTATVSARAPASQDSPIDDVVQSRRKLKRSPKQHPWRDKRGKQKTSAMRSSATTSTVSARAPASQDVLIDDVVKCRRKLQRSPKQHPGRDKRRKQKTRPEVIFSSESDTSWDSFNCDTSDLSSFFKCDESNTSMDSNEHNLPFFEGITPIGTVSVADKESDTSSDSNERRSPVFECSAPTASVIVAYEELPGKQSIIRLYKKESAECFIKQGAKQEIINNGKLFT